MALSSRDKDKLVRLIDEKIEELFSMFKIKWAKGKNYYYGQCPLCKSESKTALSYYPSALGATHSYWLCRSNNCHDTYMKSPIGLIRGLLSVTEYGGKMAEWTKTIDWIMEFVDCKGMTPNEFRQLAV